MVEKNIKEKTKQGMKWKAIETVGIQSISFIVGIILARILSPSDYGLVGMVSIFFVISNLISDSGFSSALIQKQDRNEDDFSTVFYFNLFVSIILYIIIYLSSPLISVFYNQPILTDITRVIGIGIIISSFTVIQKTRLTINLDFKTQAKVSNIATLISGPTGIICAYSGFGVWSLVIQNLTKSILTSVLLISYNKWFPKRKFSTNSFKRLFNFGSKLLVAGFVSTMVQNIYSLLIGKYFSASILGFYSKARNYPELISNNVSTILRGVTYPVLASLQEDKEKLTTVYVKLMGMTVFVILPIMTLFAILSESFINYFLTEKWSPAISLMQWLCFARIITPISSLNINILNAIGKSNLFLRIDLLKVPLVLVTLIITININIEAVVIGHFITSLISYFINSYYPGKLFGFGAINQIIAMRKIIFATIIMAIAVKVLIFYINNDLYNIFFGGIIGLFIYYFSTKLMKIPEVKEFENLILKK